MHRTISETITLTIASSLAPRLLCSGRAPILALFAISLLTAPARANSYLFAIPSTTIQTALFTPLGSDGNKYAFYDIYIRPLVSNFDYVDGSTFIANQQPGATVLANFSDYSITDFASPIPTGVDKIQASAPATAPGDGSTPNVRYTYASGDSKEALIATNSNVVGKTYEAGMTAELMPVGSTYYITLNLAPSVGQYVRFAINAVGYQFADSSALSSGIADKRANPTGYLDAAGQATPEPGVLLTLTTGLALLGALRFKRVRSRADIS